MPTLNRKKMVQYAELHWRMVIYAISDCQDFVQKAAEYGGYKFNSSGSNDMWRNYCKSKGNTLTYNIQPGDIAFRLHKPGESGYALPSKYANHSDKNDYYHVGVIVEASNGKYTICHSSGHASNGRRDTFNSLKQFAARYATVGTLKYTQDMPVQNNTSTSITQQVQPVQNSMSNGANSVENSIWNFFIGKGLKANAVAGIIGNLYIESKLDPKCLTSSKLRQTYNNESYTKAVDNGQTDFVNDGSQYGLAQWSYYSRKQSLLDYAKKAGKSIGDLNTQLAFMWNEMQSYKTMMAILLGDNSVSDCARSFMLKYEKPSNQTEANQLNRVNKSMQFYLKFTQNAATTQLNQLMTIQIINDKLNYRVGPGKSYKSLGYLPLNAKYTITEIKNNFGYMKQKQAWVMLDEKWIKKI